jgi:hypothetical protein
LLHLGGAIPEINGVNSHGGRIEGGD